MGGLAAKPGRRLVFTGLTVDLVGCGCVLALTVPSLPVVALMPRKAPSEPRR